MSLYETVPRWGPAQADGAASGRHDPALPAPPPAMRSGSFCQLTLPAGATGLVLLAQSPGRDAFASDVAGLLNSHRLATWRLRLADIGDEPTASRPGEAGAGRADEPADAQAPDRLAQRAAGWAEAIASAHGNADLAGLPIGLFADGFDAAAALHLLARGASRAGCGARLAALVCGGARLELLSGPLGDSDVATLLLVGADDRLALAANRQGLQRLACKKRLEVVPGAGSSFDRHGALAVVSELAASWFTTQLGAARWT